MLCGFDQSNGRGDAECSSTPSLAELLKQLEEQRGELLFGAQDVQVQCGSHVQDENKAFNENDMARVAGACASSEQPEDELTGKRVTA